MGALVHDCKDTVDRMVENLRANGASDREIIAAMREKISEIEYRNWGSDDW